MRGKESKLSRALSGILAIAIVFMAIMGSIDSIYAREGSKPGPDKPPNTVNPPNNNGGGGGGGGGDQPDGTSYNGESITINKHWSNVDADFIDDNGTWEFDEATGVEFWDNPEWATGNDRDLYGTQYLQGQGSGQGEGTDTASVFVPLGDGGGGITVNVQTDVKVDVDVEVKMPIPRKPLFEIDASAFKTLQGKWGSDYTYDFKDLVNRWDIYEHETAQIVEEHKPGNLNKDDIIVTHNEAISKDYKEALVWLYANNYIHRDAGYWKKPIKIDAKPSADPTEEDEEEEEVGGSGAGNGGQPMDRKTYTFKTKDRKPWQYYYDHYGITDETDITIVGGTINGETHLNTGHVSGSQTFAITPTADSMTITVVMNDGNGKDGTAWEYRIWKGEEGSPVPPLVLTDISGPAELGTYLDNSPFEDKQGSMDSRYASKKDFVMNLMKVLDGVEESRPVLSKTAYNRRNNKNQRIFMNSELLIDYPYLTQLGQLGLDPAQSTALIRHENEGLITSYVNPNVYELYFAKALRNNILNINDFDLNSQFVFDYVVYEAVKKQAASANVDPKIYPRWAAPQAVRLDFSYPKMYGSTEWGPERLSEPGRQSNVKPDETPLERFSSYSKNLNRTNMILGSKMFGEAYEYGVTNGEPNEAKNEIGQDYSTTLYEAAAVAGISIKGAPADIDGSGFDSLDIIAEGVENRDFSDEHEIDGLDNDFDTKAGGESGQFPEQDKNEENWNEEIDIKLDKDYNYFNSDNLTRMEAINILYDALTVYAEPKLLQEESDKISSLYSINYGDVEPEERERLNYLVAKGIIKGDITTNFDVRQVISQEEALLLIYRVANPNARWTIKSSYTETDKEMWRRGYAQSQLTINNYDTLIPDTKALGVTEGEGGNSHDIGAPPEDLTDGEDSNDSVFYVRINKNWVRDGKQLDFHIVPEEANQAGDPNLLPGAKGHSKRFTDKEGNIWKRYKMTEDEAKTLSTSHRSYGSTGILFNSAGFDDQPLVILLPASKGQTPKSGFYSTDAVRGNPTFTGHNMTDPALEDMLKISGVKKDIDRMNRTASIDTPNVNVVGVIDVPTKIQVTPRTIAQKVLQMAGLAKVPISASQQGEYVVILELTKELGFKYVYRTAGGEAAHEIFNSDGTVKGNTRYKVAEVTEEQFAYLKGDGIGKNEDKLYVAITKESSSNNRAMSEVKMAIGVKTGDDIVDLESTKNTSATITIPTYANGTDPETSIVMIPSWELGTLNLEMASEEDPHIIQAKQDIPGLTTARAVFDNNNNVVLVGNEKLTFEEAPMIVNKDKTYQYSLKALSKLVSQESSTLGNNAHLIWNNQDKPNQNRLIYRYGDNTKLGYGVVNNNIQKTSQNMTGDNDVWLNATAMTADKGNTLKFKLPKADGTDDGISIMYSFANDTVNDDKVEKNDKMLNAMTTLALGNSSKSILNKAQMKIIVNVIYTPNKTDLTPEKIKDVVIGRIMAKFKTMTNITKEEGLIEELEKYVKALPINLHDVDTPSDSSLNETRRLRIGGTNKSLHVATNGNVWVRIDSFKENENKNPAELSADFRKIMGYGIVAYMDKGDEQVVDKLVMEDTSYFKGLPKGTKPLDGVRSGSVLTMDGVEFYLYSNSYTGKPNRTSVVSDDPGEDELANRREITGPALLATTDVINVTEIPGTGLYNQKVSVNNVDHDYIPRLIRASIAINEEMRKKYSGNPTILEAIQPSHILNIYPRKVDTTSSHGFGLKGTSRTGNNELYQTDWESPGMYAAKTDLRRYGQLDSETEVHTYHYDEIDGSKDVFYRPMLILEAFNYKVTGDNVVEKANKEEIDKMKESNRETPNYNIIDSIMGTQFDIENNVITLNEVPQGSVVSVEGALWVKTTVAQPLTEGVELAPVNMIARVAKSDVVRPTNGSEIVLPVSGELTAKISSINGEVDFKDMLVTEEVFLPYDIDMNNEKVKSGMLDSTTSKKGTYLVYKIEDGIRDFALVKYTKKDIKVTGTKSSLHTPANLMIKAKPGVKVQLDVAGTTEQVDGEAVTTPGYYKVVGYNNSDIFDVSELEMEAFQHAQHISDLYVGRFSDLKLTIAKRSIKNNNFERHRREFLTNTKKTWLVTNTKWISGFLAVIALIYLLILWGSYILALSGFNLLMFRGEKDILEIMTRGNYSVATTSMVKMGAMSIIASGLILVYLTGSYVFIAKSGLYVIEIINKLMYKML